MSKQCFDCGNEYEFYGHKDGCSQKQDLSKLLQNKPKTMNFDEICNPVLIIGDYRLSYSFSGEDTKIGIRHISGEGGDFNKAAFLKVLEDFYAKNM